MGGGMSWAMLNRAHPDDKARKPGDYYRDKGDCECCNRSGIWWYIGKTVGWIICDQCLGLGLTKDEQGIIRKKHGDQELHKRLEARANELFNQEPVMNLYENGNGKPGVDNGKTTKEDIDELREELDNRVGKLYATYERPYVEAAKKANRLTKQATEAALTAKELEEKYKAEEFEIGELKRKFIRLKISG